MDSLQTPRNITSLDESCYGGMNAANYIYIYIVNVMRIIHHKNNSIKLKLQHGRVVDTNCCVVFTASGFPYLILCLRQCKWKLATTYLLSYKD